MFSKFFTFSLSAFIALVFTTISFGQPEPLMSLTHTPGDLNASIFNSGSIGHDTIPGQGVTWKGTDGCFAGGPLFGTSSRMRINGNMFSFPNQGGTGPFRDIQNVLPGVRGFGNMLMFDCNHNNKKEFIYASTGVLYFIDVSGKEYQIVQFGCNFST